MGDYSFFGDFEAPTLDTSAFSLGGAGGADWMSGGFGQPSFSLADVPASPGNQDWLNSLGTGAGTYGTGVPQFNEFQNNLQTPTNAPDTGGGALDWMKAGTTGLGALGNVLGLGVSGLGMANAVKAMQQGGQQQKQFKQAQENVNQAQQAAQEQQQYTRGVAAPAVQAGASLTQAGEQAMLGGPLPGQMEQMVQKWKNESRARIQNYLAKTGISDSTMAAQFESWVDQSEGEYRQKLAQSLLGSGYGGINTAQGPMSLSGQAIGESGRLGVAAGGMAAGQMGGTDQFLREANNSLALLTGAQRGRPSG